MICSDISDMDHRGENYRFFLHCAIYEQDIVSEFLNTPLKVAYLFIVCCSSLCSGLCLVKVKQLPCN